MIGALARKFFGSANDRRIKGYQSRVDAINALEPEIAALSDEVLKARTAEFRKELAEGKTLVATLAVYLNALAGKGVHVVTVNDYLARRDSEWMGQIYNFLGLTVGVIVHGLDDAERKNSYACDITYGTNNEYGFDYLRDNMKYRLRGMGPAHHL